MLGNGAAPSRAKTANLNGVLTPNTVKYHTKVFYPIQGDRNKIKQFYACVYADESGRLAYAGYGYYIADADTGHAG